MTAAGVPAPKRVKKTWPVRTAPIPTWQSAERNSAEWMRAFGFQNVKLTKGGPDGGVDVLGKDVIAQVKHLLVPVGRPQVQGLVGSRNPKLSQQMLMFYRSGYTQHAIQTADQWSVALFSYDTVGRPIPESKAARKLAAGAGYHPPAAVRRVLDSLAAQDQTAASLRLVRTSLWSGSISRVASTVKVPSAGGSSFKFAAR